MAISMDAVGVVMVSPVEDQFHVTSKMMVTNSENRTPRFQELPTHSGGVHSC
jgi:hypothetical protein